MHNGMLSEYRPNTSRHPGHRAIDRRPDIALWGVVHGVNKDSPLLYQEHPAHHGEG